MAELLSHAIILPLKENFSIKESGAVSIWVNSYLQKTKFRKNIHIFCANLSSGPYLSKENLNIIKKDNNKLFSNYTYIKKISEQLENKNIYSAEVHNRPEYAKFLIKNSKIKVNLIFHNDPNNLRDSNSVERKKFLLNNCNKIIFVSEYLKKRFFKNLNISHKNNVEVVGNAINKLKKFPKKYKLIIFSGKLNKSKGYDVFGKSIIKILDENPEWKAVAIGNEPREKHFFKHKNLNILNWLEHGKLLKYFEKSSISIVNPTWQEPFGRTAMESASRGCAVITSISGGLQETFKNNLILKKNNFQHLIKKIQFLINNKKKLLYYQKQNFNNVLHDIISKSKILDNLIPKIPKLSKTDNNLRVLHVSTFGERLNHRIFNLSISNKISKGLIRNNFDVINFDYRNFSKKNLFFNPIDEKVLMIVQNYKPHLIICGHNNILSRKTLVQIKNDFNSKIIIWYEDALAPGGPDYKESIKLLEKNNDLIDKYFVTTHPSEIKSKIPASKIYFMPVPVDANIENGSFYNETKTKDLFFALSHGVNFGKLKRDVRDDRSKFIDKLISESRGKVNFNILGLYKEEPKWNFDLNKEIMKSKIALNLSRGLPVKYYSSNRIATLMGNGCLTAINEKVKYSHFFNKNEVLIYKNSKDLINKIIDIKDNAKLIKKISKNGKKKYFKLFSTDIVSQFLIDKTFKRKNKYKYVWSKEK